MSISYLNNVISFVGFGLFVCLLGYCFVVVVLERQLEEGVLI